MNSLQNTLRAALLTTGLIAGTASGQVSVNSQLIVNEVISINPNNSLSAQYYLGEIKEGKLICRVQEYDGTAINEPLRQLRMNPCVIRVNAILGAPPQYSMPAPISPTPNYGGSSQYKGPSGISITPFVPGRVCVPIPTPPNTTLQTLPGKSIQLYNCI